MVDFVNFLILRAHVIVICSQTASGLSPGSFGRFSREIDIGVPNKVRCLEVLCTHTNNMKLAEDVDLKKIVMSSMKRSNFMAGDY